MEVLYVSLFVTLAACISVSPSSAQGDSGEAPSLFYCPDGRPIRQEWLCDGVNDCRDANATDERNCDLGSTDCSDDEFACHSGDQCIPDHWMCDGGVDCRDGSDEGAHCLPQECHSSEFRCRRSHRCIPMSFVCDGERDCGANDRTDENNCNTTGPDCGEHQYRCANGMCISANWECDGEMDCDDGSDEMECGDISFECGFGLFNCTISGRCININQVCDGASDCGSDEDEQDCPSRTCDSDEFKCADNRCILQEWVCDGDNDCGDWTDEIDCDGACLQNQYTCITGGCVNEPLRCDGNEDCNDGSDEYLCPTPPPPVSCHANQFPCQDGQQCIESGFFCDRIEHCRDGSDEDPEMCVFPSTGTNECLVDNGGCQHICRNTTNYYFCLCRHGFQVDPADKKACLDIDECSIPGTCSQLCHNENGSYSCSCAQGYEHSLEHGGCKAVGDRPAFLLFANRIDIRRVNGDGSSPQLLIKHLHNSIAIDYHYDMGYMYWTDLTQDTIRKARWDGTEVTTIINQGLEGAGGLAVDWVTNKLYWTDAEKSRIDVSDLDGSHRTTLFVNELGRPRAIVLDPSTRLMFWTDWGTQPKIERASMDGRGRVVLQDKHLIWPNALTIDYPTQTLYWGDAKLRVIESCAVDGSNRRPVATENVRHPFAITLFEDTLYWTDWELRSVQSAEKSRGGDVREVYGSLIHPMDIHVVHRARQPLIPNPCEVDNGGCSYLCLLSAESSQGYSCVCPTGVRLAANGRDCLPLNTFILFTRRSDVRRISLEVEPFIDVVLPIVNTTGATGLNWDGQTDRLYWTDIIDNTINVANINGTDQYVLIDNNILTPGGIALDWIGRKLYWTDTETDRIEVSNLDGSHRAILIYASLDKPRDIVVFPSAGLMFWSDWGSYPKIERAALDGSQRMTIADTDLKFPNGLAIDYERRLIFWVDAGHDSIQYANFDGSGRTTLLETGDQSHPFGLALYEDFVYWTDWNRRSIQRANKTSGRGIETIVSGLDNPMDIQVVHRNREEPASHPCLLNNGGCSHLCLARPQSSHPQQLEASCACPTGHVLMEDGQNCNPDVDAYLIFPTISDIRTISLDVDYTADIVLPITEVSDTSSVDVDLERNELFWTNGLDSTIYHAPLSGAPPVTLIDESVVAPTSVAVDWIGRNVYWADRGTQRIEVSKLDGSSRRVLFSKNLVSPSAVVVDFQSHLMFWTDIGDATQGRPAKIERAAMDGSGRKEIVNTNLGLPRAITVDNPVGLGGRIYWSDSFLKLIESATLDGTDRRNLLAGLSSPLGLAVFGNHLYWADFGLKTINRANKIDGSGQVVIADGFDGLGELRVIKRTDFVNKASFDHPCDTDRDCSNLCLPNRSLKKYTCSCPTGVVLGTDRKTCPKFPSVYLLFAARSTIRRISMDTEDYDDVILMSGLRNAVALDYLITGPDEGLIFWADDLARSIFSINLDGTDKRAIVTPVQLPDGLAVDWISKNIYWTDDDAHSIEVAHTNGSNRRLIANTDLENPRGIAVHPHYGLMFWSDWGLGKIERANMDGSQRFILVNDDIVWPNGIAFDYQALRIYWVDARLHRLESIGINGNGRKLIVSNTHQNIYHPFGVAVFSGFVFWSDWQNRSIFRAHLREGRGTNQQRIIDNVVLPMHLQIVSSSVPRPGELGLTPGINPGPCFYENGGCSYLCLPRNTTHRNCACPDSLQSSNTIVCEDRIGIPPAVSKPKENMTTPSTTVTPPTVPPATDEPSSEEPSTDTTNRPPNDSGTTDGPTHPEVTTPDNSNTDVVTEASGGSSLNTSILIPLVLISIGVLLVLVGIIAVAICYLKKQRDAQEQEQSLQRLAFTNPANPQPTFNQLKSSSPAPQKVTLNNAVLQPSIKNKLLQQKQPKVITNVTKTNIFVEEPEVFELPTTSRRRRQASPPDSPPLKPSSTSLAAKTESDKVPPPRPPKERKPSVESTREVRIDKIPDEDLGSGSVPPPRPQRERKPSVESTREVRINLEGDEDTDSGTHSLELKENTSESEEHETASATSLHSENTHKDDQDDTSC